MGGERNPIIEKLKPTAKILLTAVPPQSIFRLDGCPGFRRRTVQSINVDSWEKGINLSLREKILAEISTVAAEQNRTLAPLTDDLSLAESGLDSLCFAILVARLEDMTGDDPLTSAGDGRFPRTVGEFITLYEEAPT